MSTKMSLKMRPKKTDASLFMPSWVSPIPGSLIQEIEDAIEAEAKEKSISETPLTNDGMSEPAGRK